MNFTSKLFCILVGCGIFTSLAYAEPRWCSISTDGAVYTMIYSAIARAAHVSGVVISRITYALNGQLQNAAIVSGPHMLSNFVKEQMKQWTIKTDATGSELCQALVIIDFKLSEAESGRNRYNAIGDSSVLKISILAEKPVVVSMSDPSPIYVRKKHRFLLF